MINLRSILILGLLGLLLGCDRKLPQRISSTSENPTEGNNSEISTLSLISISSSGGPLAGGGTLTLIGTGFLPDLNVTIGGTFCNFPNRVSSTQATCILPPKVAGTYSVTVTNPDNQSSTLPNAYTYGPAPNLSNLSPTSSNLVGGTTLTLSGTGFVSGLAISIGGTGCASPRVVSSTQATCTLPAKTAGTYTVTVTNPDLQSSSLNSAITYRSSPVLTSISPSGGPLAGGNTITLLGSGFVDGATVAVGGTACTSRIIVSSTEATCVMPAKAVGIYSLTFTNPDGQVATLTNAYTYQSAPTVTVISPTVGPLEGGGTLTVLGTNFSTGLTITVGGTICNSPLRISATQASCTLPAKVAGTYSIAVRNPDTQTGTLSNAYTYQPSPTLTSISPSAGSLAGGGTLTLTGTGFQTGLAITVGGSTCTSPTRVSATQATCVLPARSAGTYSVLLTNTDFQSATLPNAYTYQPAPTITSVSPTTGILAGGNTVTLNGTGFIDGATITVGGTACTSRAILSPTQATCVMPAKTAGTYAVVFTNTDSQSSTLANAYTYVVGPSVTSVSPTAGPLGGGGTLTINGSAFVSGLTVTVGGVACTSPTRVSATQATCTLPARVAGVYSVVVSNPDTQSSTLANAYTYQAAPTLVSVSPTAGSLAGGGTLTLTGTGFLTGLTISIGGVACTSPNRVSSTQATCARPAQAAGTYSVVLTNSDGQNATLVDAYTYQPAPTLTSVSPTAGALAGGGTLTLTGTGFVSGLTVTVGGASCTSPTRVSATQATCTLPSRTAGTYSVVLTNSDSQSATLTNAYTYQAAPTISGISPISGSITGGNTLTINGTGFVTGLTVSVGGTPCTSPTRVSATQATCVMPAKTAGPYAVVLSNADGQSATRNNGYTYIGPAPTLTAVTPNAGALAGGTSVSITGANFVSGATVTFGTSAATSVSVVNSALITCVTPSRAAGSVTVSVTNPDAQVGSQAAAYTYQAAPTVTAISPTSGTLSGGTSVTITGTNFRSGASVSIGGNASSSVTVNSSTSITATTPAGTLGAKNVSVTNSDSQSGTLSSAYTFTNPCPTLCGSSGNGCYDKTAAITATCATLEDGNQATSNPTLIDYVTATGSFKVWKERVGSRILHASGLWSQGWQKKLNTSGKGFSATDFTDLTQLAGRACPVNGTLPSVFLNDDITSNKFAVGYCLYYGSQQNVFDEIKNSSNGTEGVDWLEKWNSSNTGASSNPAWYEGNIKACGDLGMRLPTIFETQVTAPSSPYTDFPTSDGTPDSIGGPTFAGSSGIPAANTWMFTASASTDDVCRWWHVSASNILSRTNACVSGATDFSASVIRCVLP